MSRASAVPLPLLCWLWGLAVLSLAEDPPPPPPAAAEATPSEEGAPAAPEAAAAEEAKDETKELLDQLTIAMASEVIDARTFEIRDSAAKTGKKIIHFKLGNTRDLERGAGASDEEHEEKAEASKEALSKLVAKQMVWWKAAPDEHQPATDADDKGPAVVLGDVWLIDGRHVNSLLVKEGHLAQEEHYHSELAKDILSAAADKEKKDSYKKLEEALKESEREKRKIAEQKLEEEKLKGEPIGFAGWLGLGVLLVIVLGALTNFGRGSGKKKVNLNRKRSAWESFWAKVKGA
mmetsp:Transcript_86872/g.218708  ORF Transcript_86872/g.218708 Transcript_86872/m.218708 type:complete len:291 (+) Transcript_86872:68-940(+)